MSWDVRILSGKDDIAADVTKDNALKVSLTGGMFGNPTEQTPEELTSIRYFSSYLTDSGSSKDMNIDGSVTPVEFTEDAQQDRIKWITRIRIVIWGDEWEINSNDFRRFGSATAINTPLTNGVTFEVVQGGITTSIFTDPVTTAGDFFDYIEDYDNFVNAIDAQSDFLRMDLEFVEPIVLPPTVTDQLVMTIQDDLTALDRFRVALSGFQEYI